MKKTLIAICATLIAAGGFAQVTPSPAKAQSQAILIQDATIHIGNGKVASGDLLFDKGKIVESGRSITAPEGAIIINAKGKHVYPGFIAVNSDLGLTEIESVRATRDNAETGLINASARALIAYNTDSKVIPTVRSNGVLLAQVAPQGGLVCGASSVVQLDAWNYEDAVIKADDAIYLNWYNMTPFEAPYMPPLEEQKKRIKESEDKLHAFMQGAIAYKLAKEAKTLDKINASMEAMIPVINKEKKLFIRANSEKQIGAAVAFARQYDVKVVIVGGQEAYLQIELLKKNNIPVVLSKPHNLPVTEEDPIDTPYRCAKLLGEAEIPFCFDMDVFWNERNLPFQAGTAVAYGLPKEEGVKSLTLNPAIILGIDAQMGSLEAGKDATLIISEGDVLDMRTSRVTRAFIQGRDIDLNDLHKQLYDKFSKKYE